MATFVLVHGSWQGGWCWGRVAPHLRARGHVVHTPTLTGLGERRHLASRDVDLGTQTRDVANVLEFEDLSDAILVGHSYAGILLPGVGDLAGDRLARIVYLEAAMAATGESLADLLGPELAGGLKAAVDGHDGWREPPVPLDLLQVTAPEDVAWVAPRLTDNMYLPQIQPAQGASELARSIPRTFVWCDDPTGAHQDSPFFAVWSMFRERAEGLGWPVVTVPSGHEPMVTHPVELARLLDEIAPAA
jgi:pimeloyl-ACP methyl ester carboxylesterase